jgi:hypothetical protein
VVIAIYQVNNYLVAYNVVNITVTPRGTHGVAYLKFHMTCFG